MPTVYIFGALFSPKTHKEGLFLVKKAFLCVLGEKRAPKCTQLAQNPQKPRFLAFSGVLIMSNPQKRPKCTQLTRFWGVLAVWQNGHFGENGVLYTVDTKMDKKRRFLTFLAIFSKIGQKREFLADFVSTVYKTLKNGGLRKVPLIRGTFRHRT